MSGVSDRGDVIRGLIADRSAPSEDAADYLRQVSRSAATTLSATGAGISVMTGNGVRGVSGASDALSERVEELQFVLGEGPCIDAFATRRPVLIDDLGNEAGLRWPVYVPAVRDYGVRAVFAFPLLIGAARLGVLDVFREDTGALSAGQLTDALCFAEVTVAALLEKYDDIGAHGGVVEAVVHRAELFQAQGMVMVQLGSSIDEAMTRMRAYAYAENRTLGEVAHDVVTRRLSFEQDHV